jgi:hypothetical protein
VLATSKRDLCAVGLERSSYHLPRPPNRAPVGLLRLLHAPAW